MGGLYNPPARQNLVGDMVKPDIYETVRCNPLIERENNIIHHTGNFQSVIIKYSQIFKEFDLSIKLLSVNVHYANKDL